MNVFLRFWVLHCLGLSAACSITFVAAAQSCQDQLRMAPAGSAAVTVSARELGIPRKAWEHFEKACSAAETNRVEVFDRESKLALAQSPDLTELYILRALIEIHAREYEAAFATIAAARQLRPNLAWASVVTAGALNDLHRFAEASAELDRAGSTEMERWQWRFERTRAEIGQRNLTGALHWSERLLAIAPVTCTDAQLLRVNALQMAGRLQDAVVQMEAYLRSGGELRHQAEVIAILKRTRSVLEQKASQPLVSAK